MGHHRLTAPSRLSFLSAQQHTPATQQCTLRDAPVALGAPAGHSTRLALSIAELLRMGGGVAADEGAEASGRGAPNSEPAAPLVPPMKVRSGTAQRPPASKRTKQEPVEAITGMATGATCTEPKRQAKGRTVDWAAALVVTVATLAALFSRSLARSQAPDEVRLSPFLPNQGLALLACHQRSTPPLSRVQLRSYGPRVCVFASPV